MSTLLLCLFLSTYTVAQTISSEVVNASIPKGAKHISTEELSNYLKSNYKYSQISFNRANVFKMGRLIISFWDLSVNPVSKKSLEDSQLEILGYLKYNPENVINFSKIETINNIRFLIYQYQKGDETFLRFQSEFNSKNRNICGIVQFKKPDENDAHAALKELLESVHFKEL